LEWARKKLPRYPYKNIYYISERSGILVKEAPYNETGIAVNDFPNGVYFVVIENGTAVERLKFIKK
jgi:hypothetical protein